MGKSVVIEQRQPQAEAPACQHHWLIDSPRGATSMGRCKRCGEEREFRNSATDYLWEDDSRGGYRPWRGVRSIPRVADEDEASAAPASADVPALAL